MSEWWGIAAIVAVAAATSAVAVLYYSSDEYSYSECFETVDQYRDELDWVREDARSQISLASKWIRHIYVID